VPAGAGATLAVSGGGAAVVRPHPPAKSAAHRWVFALTFAFFTSASVLRSVLEFEGGQRLVVLALVATWVVLVLAEPFAQRVWSPAFVIYLVAQGGVLLLLLGQSESSDYFAVLLAVPVMQATERWRPRPVAVLIAVFALLSALVLSATHGAVVTISLVAFYAVADAFFAAYGMAARRAIEEKARNDALAAELREANRSLTESAEQARRLGGARERQRLARELHDSVTQTLFSMTLTVQATRLLLERDPGEARGQLAQLDELTRGALQEMSALGSDLPASISAQGGLVAALERHCTERKLRDGLVVTLEVDGDDPVPAEDEQSLMRIAQEGLNNVVKHAGVGEAAVRLRLRRPFRLEVEDRGLGFDPEQAGGAGLGLTSMTERAAEMGWSLTVTSTPGSGTRVVAEEAADEGGHDRG
jgi:signal transduction histidine kinase